MMTMIQVQIQKNSQGLIHAVIVQGHANYAPNGYDIICASVSTLLQVMGYTLEEHQEVDLDFTDSGFGTIEIKEPDRNSHMLMEAFQLGIELLTEQYPEHVALEMS